MSIKAIKHVISTIELRLSSCDFGCKIYGCSCGGEHVWHSAVYGCPTGKALAGLPTLTSPPVNDYRTRYTTKVNCTVCGIQFPNINASEGHEHFTTVTIDDEDTYEQMREAAAMEKLTGECPITEVKDCQSRHCELHYMSAPLKLEPGASLTFVSPGTCAVCLGEADHQPLDAAMGCADVFGPMRGLTF